MNLFLSKVANAEEDRVGDFYRNLMPLPKVMADQLEAKKLSEQRETLEKSAALFGKKKPDEYDALKEERAKAIEAFKQNTGRLDQLNPQAKADVNQAMGAARNKVQESRPAAQPTPTPRKPIQDFGEYFKEQPSEKTVPKTAPKITAASEPVGSRVAAKAAAKPTVAKGKLALIAGGTALAAGGAKLGYDKWKEEKVAFSEMREQLEKSAASLK